MNNQTDKIAAIVNVHIRSSLTSDEVVEHYNKAFYVFLRNNYIEDNNECDQNCRVVENMVDSGSKSIYEWRIDDKIDTEVEWNHECSNNLLIDSCKSEKIEFEVGQILSMYNCRLSSFSIDVNSMEEDQTNKITAGYLAILQLESWINVNDVWSIYNEAFMSCGMAKNEISSDGCITDNRILRGYVTANTKANSAPFLRVSHAF